MKKHYTNITRINIFVVINQINKHKAKICNHCVYTQIIIKKIYFFSLSYIKIEGIIIDFGEKKTTEKEFYGNDNKKIFNIKDININIILISKESIPGINRNSHVIRYKDNHNIKPLYIKLPKYICSGKTFKKI